MKTLAQVLVEQNLRLFLFHSRVFGFNPIISLLLLLLKNWGGVPPNSKS